MMIINTKNGAPTTMANVMDTGQSESVGKEKGEVHCPPSDKRDKQTTCNFPIENRIPITISTTVIMESFNYTLSWH